MAVITPCMSGSAAGSPMERPMLDEDAASDGKGYAAFVEAKQAGLRSRENFDSHRAEKRGGLAVDHHGAFAILAVSLNHRDDLGRLGLALLDHGDVPLVI